MIGQSLVYLFLGAAVVAAEYSCPSDWLDLGENHGCFLFAKDTGPVNWFEAQYYCNSLYENAYLAEIMDSQTQTLLANSPLNDINHGWWLGGADFFGEKQWRWQRSMEPITYLPWAGG